MGFVRTREELDRYYQLKERKYFGSRMLGVMIEVKPETASRLIPPPLLPGENSGGLIFIAEYPETNLGPGYREAALFLNCRYNGEAGSYCLSMPIESEDARMHNGRDIFGFPKKMARIHIEKDGRTALGWVERHGIRFVEINLRLTDPLPALPGMGPTFLFKASPRIDLTPGFDGPVYLCRQQTDVKMKHLEIGAAEISLRDSAADPWSELEPVKALLGFYLVSDNTMLPGKVIAEVDPETYLPYYFKMTDFFCGE